MNGKKLKTAAALAVASSIIVPAAYADASTTVKIQSVVIEVNGAVYSVDYTNYLDAKVFDKYSASPKYIEINGKHYLTSDYNELVVFGKLSAPEALAKLASEGKVQNITPTKTTITNGQLVTSPVTGDLKVESVSAINGTVTVVLDKAPAVTPVAADFTVKQSINGGTSTTVTPTAISWNATTKTATLTVPAVAQTNQSQSVVASASYKGSTAKSAAAYTVNVSTVSVIAVGAAGGNQLRVVFSQPIHADSLAAANFSYFNDITNVNGTAAFPNGTPVFVEPTIGSFDRQQVVNLSFAAATITAANGNQRLTIKNLKDANGTAIPEITVNVAGVTAADNVVPGITANTLTFGSQLNQVNVLVNAGDKVTLKATVQDTNPIAALQYRFVRPNGTTTSWTNSTPADNSLGGTIESLVQEIDTTGFAPGQHNVQIRAIDPLGNVGSVTNNNINIQGSDLVAPATAIAVGGGTYNAIATNTVPARSITIEGSATDGRSNISKVQYRIQTYSASVDAYTDAQGWTDATPVDGTYNTQTEAFRFTTSTLNSATTYRIQVRSVDAAGNAENPQTVTVANAATHMVNLPAAITVVAAAGAVTANTTFTMPVTDVTLPTFTVAPAFVAGSNGQNPHDSATAAAASNVRDVRVTATAGDAGGITKVEYAVYKATNMAAPEFVQVQGWTTTGVTTDGQLGGISEAVTINTQLPDETGAYRIVLRTTDSSGNVSAETIVAQTGGGTLNHTFLDRTAPTATITPNTATAANTDFIVTFSEAVLATGGALIATDGAAGANVYDADNYKVLAADGTVLQSVATAIAANANPGAPANSYIITFGTAPVAGQVINVVGVRDLSTDGTLNSGLRINPEPTTFTVQ